MSRAAKKKITGGSPADPAVSVVVRIHDPRQVEAFTEVEIGKKRYEEIASGQLKAIIERIERLDDERKAVITDIKEIFGEAKANGFDVKVLRKLLALRKVDRDTREQFEALVELYQQALGMI